MISIYCRLDAAPPTELITLAAQNLAALPVYYTTPLSVGLQNILENQKAGKCGSADLRPLVHALPALDKRLQQHYGTLYNNYWLLRFTMAELLLENGQAPSAINSLRQLWQSMPHQDIPTLGLTLAQALNKTGLTPEASRVLTELERVTTDAPDDFKAEMQQLRTSLPPTAHSLP